MSQVSFPVYRLPSKPSEDGGIIFYASEDEDKDIYRVRIVDDLNEKGKTLAARRLRLLSAGKNLYQFKLSVFFIGDLIRLSNSSVYWIDSNGKLFKYTKNKHYRLLNRKVTMIRNFNGYWIFEVEGLPMRFKSMYGPPGASYTRALVLEDKQNFIFYGFTDQEETTARHRKV